MDKETYVLTSNAVKCSLQAIEATGLKINQLGLLTRNLGTKPEFENTFPVNVENVQEQAKYISDALKDAYEDLTDTLDTIEKHGGINFHN